MAFFNTSYSLNIYKGNDKMITLTKYLTASLLAVFLIFPSRGISQGEPYSALKDVRTIKAVFDIRVNSPRVLANHLDLIVDMFNDPYVKSVQPKPDFVVILMGSAVKYLSGMREGYSPSEVKDLDFIATILPEMARLGIKLEVCMVAARQFGLNLDTLIPEIVQVPNGWISSIGYQSQGYALIADL